MLREGHVSICQSHGFGQLLKAVVFDEIDIVGSTTHPCYRNDMTVVAVYGLHVTLVLPPIAIQRVQCPFLFLIVEVFELCGRKVRSRGIPGACHIQ